MTHRAFTVEEIRKCYNDALAQAPGANILINYREDTTYTSLPVSYKVKYVVEGEAAQQMAFGMGMENIAPRVYGGQKQA